MMKTLLGLALLAGVLVRPAPTYIENIYPLQQFLGETEVVVEGVIEKADLAKKVFKVKCGKVLKGKNAYASLNINVGAGKEWHPDAVIRHVVEGIPTLCFYNGERKGMLYMNKFFIQIYGDAAAAPESAWWSMQHVEIRMNRTFAGTVPELSKLVSDVMSGKKKAPEPNLTLPPISKQALARMPRALKNGAPEPLPPPDPNAGNAVHALLDKGFIGHWLVLAPIPIGEKAGDHTEAAQKAFFDREWIPGQKKLLGRDLINLKKPNHPRDQEKAKINDIELVWEATETTEPLLDLGTPPNAMALTVTYLVADADLDGLTLLTGSDESSTWWLNGEEVQRVYIGRTLAPDLDRTSKTVSLKKGVNVLMAAVINGSGPSGLSARFVDAAGNPVKNLRVCVSPTPVDRK